MLKFHIIFFIIAAIAINNVLSLNKRQTITCLNSGRYNTATMKCDCFPAFTGTDCSQLMCDKQDPATCASYNKTYCSVKLINDYCPKLCDRCKCNPVTCQNNGRYNNATCKCDCFTSKLNKSDSLIIKWINNLFIFKVILERFAKH
jgi:hypothetical protein